MNNLIKKGDTVEWSAHIQYEAGKDAFKEGKFTAITDTSIEEITRQIESDSFGFYDWRATYATVVVIK